MCGADGRTCRSLVVRPHQALSFVLNIFLARTCRRIRGAPLVCCTASALNKDTLWRERMRLLQCGRRGAGQSKISPSRLRCSSQVTQNIWIVWGAKMLSINHRNFHERPPWQANRTTNASLKSQRSGICRHPSKRRKDGARGNCDEKKSSQAGGSTDVRAYRAVSSQVG